MLKRNCEAISSCGMTSQSYVIGCIYATILWIKLPVLEYFSCQRSVKFSVSQYNVLIFSITLTSIKEKVFQNVSLCF